MSESSESNAEQSHSRRQDRPVFGLMMFLCSLVLMTIISGLVKELADRYPLQQILLFRFALTFLPFAVIVWLSGGKSPFQTKFPKTHIIRSVSGIISIGMMFFALSAISIADATALVYAAPIFITIMSVPFLGETLGFRRLSSVAFGFIGMTIIVEPGITSVGLGVLAGVGSAFFSAIVTIAVRKLGDTEPTSHIAFFYNGMGTIVWVVCCLVFGWVMPTLIDFLLLAAIGLVATVQQYLMTSSFRYGEANLLGAFEYSALVMAAIAGYVFWDEIPGLNTFIGAGIIVASGLFVIHREATLKRQSRQPVLKSETPPGG